MRYPLIRAVKFALFCNHRCNNSPPEEGREIVRIRWAFSCRNKIWSFSDYVHCVALKTPCSFQVKINRSQVLRAWMTGHGCDLQGDCESESKWQSWSHRRRERDRWREKVSNREKGLSSDRKETDRQKPQEKTILQTHFKQLILYLIVSSAALCFSRGPESI